MKIDGIRFDEHGRKFHCVSFFVDEYPELTSVVINSDTPIHRDMTTHAREWLDKNANGWRVAFAPLHRKQMTNLWVPSETAAIMFKMTFDIGKSKQAFG
jgi:hypothetical protein